VQIELVKPTGVKLTAETTPEHTYPGHRCAAMQECDLARIAANMRTALTFHGRRAAIGAKRRRNAG
jgi:hypothetical protein